MRACACVYERENSMICLFPKVNLYDTVVSMEEIVVTKHVMH